MNKSKVICVLLQIIVVLGAVASRTLQDSSEEYNVERNDVKFRLFTRSSPTKYIQIKTGELKAGQIANKPTKLIVHGYLDSASSGWMKKMVKELLAQEDCNVICVDWSGQALTLYPLASEHVPFVGKFVGDLIVDMHKTCLLPFSNFHCIGHSLGAHVCGFAGKTVQEQTKEKIWRITAMDPAGPLFTGKPRNSTLAPDDAQITDAMHTDCNKYGSWERWCQVDCYANTGASPQPGCIFYDSQLPYYAPGDIVSCSHMRAIALVTESISSKAFIGTMCNNATDYSQGKCAGNPTASMGICNSKVPSGTYYLHTNRRSPFAKNGEM